jgi:transposase
MQQEQIIALFIAGESIDNISKKLGIHRDTVSSYVKQNGFAVQRGRRAKTGNCKLRVPTGTNSKATIRVSGCPPGISQSLCEPYREFIEERLGRGMDAYYIWYDLKIEASFVGGYDSVKRFVRKLKQKMPEVFAVMATTPGLEGQVDYGRGALTKHPVTGRYQRPWLFCYKLSHSRRAFRKVVWKSSSLMWAKLHEEAFHFFGGVPATTVLDNLKEGVIRANIYDPELNVLYSKMLEHYGSVALPCRVATPRHKGKVENEIKYTQGALKGRTFETIEEQQRFLESWGAQCADTRIHGTVKRQVLELFLSEEKPALKKLPDERFGLSQVLTRKVHSDGHVIVENAYYSVPHTHVGQEVTACVDHMFVLIIDSKTHVQLAKHVISKPGRFNSKDEHLPLAKQTTSLHRNLLLRAAAIGKSTQELAQQILTHDPYRSIRQIQGILSFSRKYQSQEIEAVATVCIEKGLHSYRAMKNILQHKVTAAETIPSLTQNHECIRSFSEYNSLWNERTQFE